MSITDELRKSFDQCTYKAGVAPDEFDTVWITKSCALSMLDEIDAAFEAGHSRAVEYGKMIGRGTCEADETETIKCWVKCKDEPSTERMELIHVMECSECGHTYEHVNGDYEFCPRCGRRRVVDE